MSLKQSLSIYKFALAFLFFALAFEVKADSVSAGSEAAEDAHLIGLAVRSEAGTFLLADAEMPLANVPVNFFALFQSDVAGSVELELVGPVSFTRRGLAEPYGLFEDIALESLPAGQYALRIKVIDANGAASEARVYDFKLNAAADQNIVGAAALAMGR